MKACSKFEIKQCDWGILTTEYEHIKSLSSTTGLVPSEVGNKPMAQSAVATQLTTAQNNPKAWIGRIAQLAKRCCDCLSNTVSWELMLWRNQVLFSKLSLQWNLQAKLYAVVSNITVI